MQDSKTPQHVAIIMDGNGRWAKQQGKLRHEGHAEGAKAVRKTLEAARKFNIKYISLYAFSSENWSRPEIEVKTLMLLFEKYIKEEKQSLIENKIRFRVIGRLSLMPKTLLKKIQELEQETAEFDEQQLILCVSYGGQQELVDACKAVSSKVLAGELQVDEINEQVFADHLYAPDLPNPELLIRTSNEQRLSNFLPWQLSYSEFVFVPELWPDFDETIFKRCIEEYQSRQRRYGKV